MTVALQTRIDDPDDDFTEEDVAITRPHLVMVELQQEWGLEYVREEFP